VIRFCSHLSLFEMDAEQQRRFLYNDQDENVYYNCERQKVDFKRNNLSNKPGKRKQFDGFCCSSSHLIANPPKDKRRLIHFSLIFGFANFALVVFLASHIIWMNRQLLASQNQREQLQQQLKTARNETTITPDTFSATTIQTVATLSMSTTTATTPTTATTTTTAQSTTTTTCLNRWTIGDGRGGREKRAGTMNANECVEKCKLQGANGATMNNDRKTVTGCWCEFNQSGVAHTLSYINLMFC